MSETTMSLHRVIAEIKNLEAKLGTIGTSNFVVSLVDGKSDVQAAAIADATRESQKEFDKHVSAFKNLASLKSARNLANSIVKVTIDGKEMTIDQALSMKASIPHREMLLAHLQAQFQRAQARVDQVAAQIDVKINQQIAAMSAGSKQVSAEALKVIRDGVEKDQKLVVVHAAGLKDTIEKMKGEIERFNVEVDYVLSEANATNTVKVSLV